MPGKFPTDSISNTHIPRWETSLGTFPWKPPQAHVQVFQSKHFGENSISVTSVENFPGKFPTYGGGYGVSWVGWVGWGKGEVGIGGGDGDCVPGLGYGEGGIIDRFGICPTNIDKYESCNCPMSCSM